jgi:hypothetical protein
MFFEERAICFPVISFFSFQYLASALSVLLRVSVVNEPDAFCEVI